MQTNIKKLQSQNILQRKSIHYTSSTIRLMVFGTLSSMALLDIKHFCWSIKFIYIVKFCGKFALATVVVDPASYTIITVVGSTVNLFHLGDRFCHQFFFIIFRWWSSCHLNVLETVYIKSKNLLFICLLKYTRHSYACVFYFILHF